MYLVRVSFTNRYRNHFHWDFSIDTYDYAEAIREAVVTFTSGLTHEERQDAAHTLEFMAHPYRLPDSRLPLS
jgi:hypothetical protein